MSFVITSPHCLKRIMLDVLLMYCFFFNIPAEFMKPAKTPAWRYGWLVLFYGLQATLANSRLFHVFVGYAYKVDNYSKYISGLDSRQVPLDQSLAFTQRSGAIQYLFRSLLADFILPPNQGHRDTVQV